MTVERFKHLHSRFHRGSMSDVIRELELRDKILFAGSSSNAMRVNVDGEEHIVHRLTGVATDSSTPLHMDS